MSRRYQMLRADIRCVIGACKDDPTCPFSDFEQGENLITFNYSNNNEGKTYTIHLSEDYPEHTLVSCSDRPEDAFTTNERIPLIFNRLAEGTDLWKQVNLHPPEISSSSGSSEDEEDSQEYFTHDSGGNDLDDYDLEVDIDDYYNDAHDLVEERMHPQLDNDIKSVEQRFGAHAINTRIFSSIDDVDAELNIDMSFLDEEIAKAWKVNRQEPIVIRLHLSFSQYLDANEPPKVEVFQPSNKETFGLGMQIQKIMETFLSKEWKDLSNDRVTAICVPLRPISARASHPHKGASSHGKKLKQLHEMSKSFQSFVSSWKVKPVKKIHDRHVAQLVDMGFTVEMARNALFMTRNNLEEAINLLLTQPERPAGGGGAGSSSSFRGTWTSALFLAPSVAQQHQVVLPARPSQTPATIGDELHLVPCSTERGRTAKTIPGLEYGFLAQCLIYARNRIPTLNEYCVVCDEPHIFQNGAMLKPVVCEREVCVFAFQQLGVMRGAADDIATGAEVVDLLLAMVKASSHSPRKDLILDPFPSVVDPDNAKEMVLSPKKKNFDRVNAILDSLMSVREMTQASVDMKKQLDKKDKYAWPFLSWVISSNRSHIVKLPESRRIKFMHTPHQFLLLSSPPAKEQAFREAKRQHGSLFAFHGSHIENWHSILRHGLINASGTKHQLHGAAYGSGIYLSPNSSVSFGYSCMGHGSHKAARNKALLVTPHRKGFLQGCKALGCTNQTTAASEKTGKKENTKRFLESDNLTCIALCEVIHSKELRKHNNIWVVPNPDHVCTRFFFVYEDGQVGDSMVDTTQEKYQKEILRAIGNMTATD
ncbi:protein mono-ADP-ribosyltransferase PARP6-like isoform X3 [Branchiostoma lanceolatum]|uniref:protein mono-ADP-ribosyltransferase PARP6-like isoform X3 n=1 Tax=Branchiostoma lanceolatum TaxID=7740 RepID=UPI0034535AFC